MSQARRKIFFLFITLCCLAAFSSSIAAAGGKKSQPAPGIDHAVIAGYQRFFTKPGVDAARAGRLLLGELNCTSCHRANESQAAFLMPKQAPVLSDVGNRAKRSYLRQFLSNPHKTKPGTAMPDVFAGIPEAQRKEQIEALVHFLASTGTLRHESLDHPQAGIGRQLYGQVGCVACHGSRNAEGKTDKVLPTSIRLERLSAKFTIPSLGAFLANPLHSRPSGRMPGILDAKESRAVAHYLLQDIPAPPANLTFAYYEGGFGNLPDFTKLKPNYFGRTNGISLKLARRGNNYALKWDGYLKIEKEGDYRFYTRSDDGSRLIINGKTVVNNDGTHAPQTKGGMIHLTKGMHKTQVQFFQAPGGAELRVEFQGPDLRRQALASHLFLTEKGNIPVAKNGKKKEDEDFRVDAVKVTQGRKVFASVGCASCHELKAEGQQIQSTIKSPPLAKVAAVGGCLSETAKQGVPQFRLDGKQRAALASAIVQLKTPPAQRPSEVARIGHTMTALNCYACHERDKIGGPEGGLEKHFTTVQPEMGDEGRIPPTLDGVGAKLKSAYFAKILDQGANDRPYMHTRMPRFGKANAGHLPAQFAKLDSLPAVKEVKFATTFGKVRRAARFMVGAKAFACIKCHTFAGHKAEGVQGMDMAIMTERVKNDWFRHYLIDPQKFRAGTRMPTSWPNGNTQLPKLLGGDTHQQVEAIWVYLAQGKKAALPVGLSTKLAELIPEKDAIIYRNFIAGAGTRAIGVGYPEQAHLAFDANQMRIAMLWQGAFIDASRHWNGRGQGFQPPLGGSVLNLPGGPTFAVLENADQPWPTKAPKELGYKFRGYRLGKDQRPTFIYDYGKIRIEDFPNPVEGKTTVSMKRTLTLSADRPVMDFYFRAAAAGKIEPLGKGWFRIDGKYRVWVGELQARLRRIGSTSELLVPVQFEGKRAQVVQEFVW